MARLSLAAAAVALTLVDLHGPNGQVISINPAEVSSIREPRANEGHFAKGVQCLVTMTNGNFNAVVESCNDVRDKLEKSDGQVQH